MSLNQILLVVGALALLATLQLSVNSTLTRATILTYEGEATIAAVSMGQAMIDEVLTKEYDERTIGNRVFQRDSLTPIILLGPEGITESVSPFEREPYQSEILFDDVDDYHGYSRIDSSHHLGAFAIFDTVYYVQEMDQNLRAVSRTWYKKIVVTVKHPNLYAPVILRSLVVYRRFF